VTLSALVIGSAITRCLAAAAVRRFQFQRSVIAVLNALMGFACGGRVGRLCFFAVALWSFGVLGLLRPSDDHCAVVYCPAWP
jgi:hypothetical protein